MKAALVPSGVLLCVLLALPAQAAVFGSSNMYGSYPSPSCREPYVPLGNDRFSRETFYRELEEYTRCIEDYIEGAKNDRERILEQINNAVDDYNRFVRSLQ